MPPTPTHISCLPMADRASYPITLTDYYRSCDKKLFSNRYTLSNTQGLDASAVWKIVSKDPLTHDSYSQTSPKDDNRLLQSFDQLLKINEELANRMTKFEEKNISLSQSNDDLVKRVTKIEAENSSLMVGHKDLQDRCNQLTLQQALSDMLTYLIHVLSLLSNISRTPSLSVGTLSECLANSVPRGTTDNVIDVCSLAHEIVDKLSMPTLPEVKNKDHSTDEWKHIIELLHRLLPLETFQDTEKTPTDHDLVSLMIYLQTIKQERNIASHILPHWRRLHLCMDQIERDLTRVCMSVKSIDDGHRICCFKPILLKIVETICGIFKQVNESKEEKYQSYSELMNDIFQILEAASSNSSAPGSADSSNQFV